MSSKGIANTVIKNIFKCQIWRYITDTNWNVIYFSIIQNILYQVCQYLVSRLATFSDFFVTMLQCNKNISGRVSFYVKDHGARRAFIKSS